MRILIVTKSRSGYGSHVVLTAIIRQLRREGHFVEVFVSEHRLERHKWSAHHYLWAGVEPTIIDFKESTIIKHDSAYGPYAYTDDILLHDKSLVERLRSIDVESYDLVLLDSWYLMYSAFLSGIHLKHNVFQFVQSEPVFEPTVKEDEWKAAIFMLMPWVPARRIFVSHALARKFNAEYRQQHGAVGFFLDRAFLEAEHRPRTLMAQQPLCVVSMASNFNIPTKGLQALTEALKEIHKIHPITLKLICTIPITTQLPEDFPIQIVSDATDPSKRAQELIDADVYVTCTTNESPGLAQAEAIATGLPSVALDSNGNRDYYTGDNFLMAHNNDDLVAHLMSCLDDENRSRMSQTAKQSMRGFSVEACTKRILDYARLSQGYISAGVSEHYAQDSTLL